MEELDRDIEEIKVSKENCEEVSEDKVVEEKIDEDKQKSKKGFTLASVIIGIIVVFGAGIAVGQLLGKESETEVCVETKTVREDIDVRAREDKPVIYLYSDEDNKTVKVSLDTKGEVYCEYPKRENGVWEVSANKDGVIKGDLGAEYNYLYWEGKSDTDYDFRTGFCVKGEDSANFLECSLAKLGLSREEENEFIVYWLPKLEANKYNLISFQTERYTDAYKLNVEPVPDNMLRVFMAFKGLDEPVDIVQQDLESIRGNFVREGFYVVEWGGADCGRKQTIYIR